ncbi:MAG: hypothetical protein NTX87_03770 [Planctomycetota bacterium]|nr:hypothetical protein [Planctomycetota bacterium]
MAEAPPPPSPRKGMGPDDKRLMWLVVIAAWMVLAAWALMTLRPRLPWRPGRPTAAPTGRYEQVREFVPPLALRLESRTLARPAGIAVPGERPAAERAAARLKELAPPGTVVYVELEPRSGERESAAAAASLWLPPADAARQGPFPYEQSRLIGAILVQEGLVAVDPDQPYLYKNEFQMLEDDARRHGRGLWASQ